MRSIRVIIILLFIAVPILAHATVFATLHGIVHDPEHRPIANAQITLEAAESGFVLRGLTAANGEFRIAQVPIGVYRLAVSAPGFASVTQSIKVASGTNPVVHIPLPLPNSTESVVVRADANSLSTDSATPTTIVTRQNIDETPGASRTLGHADDHRLRAGRLHDPRHAAHQAAATRQAGCSMASRFPT